MKQATTSSAVVRLLRENLRTQLPLYTVAIIAMATVAAMTALTAWVMGGIVEAMSDSTNPSQAYRISLIVICIFATKGIAGYAQTVSLSRAGNSIVAHQQKRLYAKLLTQGAAFFDANESSNLLMKITQSAQSARNIIDTVVTTFVRDLLTLISLIAVMFYQQPVLSAFSLIVGPIALGSVRIILRRVSKTMTQQLQSLSEIFKVMQETSAGIMVIKVFSLEAHMTHRMDDAVSKVNKRANTLAQLQAITSPLMETLSGFAIAGIVALSAASTFGAMAASPGQLVSFVTALLMAYEPAKRLIRMRLSIEANLAGVQMMHDLMDQPNASPETQAPVKMTSMQGGLRFENVFFSYDRKKNIIEDLTLECNPGETVALVGQSGGGKSTILHLMLRLYDPSSGTITLNGVDIKLLTFKDLRDKISFVSQSTFLFSTTIMENIRFGRSDANDDDVISAAKSAYAHDFILSLDKGYQTEVGENGAFLSGGQKQRIMIARALLKNSPILLLDEATSALDAQSETAVQTALSELTKGRTTLVIAHRLSTILAADRVYVIEQGHVAESGSPQSLLTQNGPFRNLYNQQFKNTH